MSPYRVGLIVPSSNVTVETELPLLLARHRTTENAGFSFHSSRAALHNVDPESLREMVAQADRCALELAHAQLDVVAYGCLIAIMAEGAGAHERAEARLAGVLSSEGSNAPVTSSAGALVRTLVGLGAKRVSLVTPYMRPLTGVVIDYLAGYGIEVVSSLSLEVPDNVEVGRLDPHQLVGLAKGLDLARSDAVILSACVQMPSLAVLDEAERQLSRPVLSAATATAREVLELLGEPPLVDGAGAALAGMAFAG